MDEETLAELAECHGHITTCLAKHTTICPAPLIYSSRWANSFPLRLLDVRAHHGDRCYLVLGETTISPYVTLSYVWGTALPSKTLLGNLRSHMTDGLIIDALPKTVRDAIAVTRLFNVEYIWVDALCIVQDDEHEWRVESAKMDSIYMGAYFTIAAVNARSCQDGFFGRNLNRDIVTDTVTFKRQHLYFDLQGPLFLRGWTLQERLLSSRILYFTTTWGVYYECSNNSEALVPGDTIGRFRGQTSDATSFFLANWMYLVGGYCRRELTIKTDKLVALQGLIKYLHIRSGFEISYGHWHHKFVEQLFWHSDDTPWPAGAIKGRVGYHNQRSNVAPSWSWASKHQGEVTWSLNQSFGRRSIEHDMEFSLRRVQDLSAERAAVMHSLLSSTSPPSFRYQSPDDQILTITGFLLPVTLVSKDSPRLCNVSLQDSNMTLTPEDGLSPAFGTEDRAVRHARRRQKGRARNRALKGDAQADVQAEAQTGSSSFACHTYLEQSEIPPTAFIFLPGITSSSRETGQSQAHFHFLVLTLVHEPDYYERIGMGMPATTDAASMTCQLSGVSKQEIVII